LGVRGAATLSGATTINNTLSVDSNGEEAGGHTFNVNDSGISLTSQSNSGIEYTDHALKNSLTVGDDRAYTNKDGITTTEGYGTIVTGRMYVDGDLTVNGYLTSANPNTASGIMVNNSGVSVDGRNNAVGIFADDNKTTSDGRAELNLQKDTASLTVVNPANRESHGLTVNTEETALSDGTGSTTLMLNDTGATLRANRNPLLPDGGGSLKLQENAVSLTVVNPTTQNTHGIMVDSEKTIISGGTNSTSLTLNDNGATFRNDDTGGAARVTGIANGTHDHDAANYGQLQKAYSGVASAAALAAIPDPTPGKRYFLGLGYGTYLGEDAIAVGLKGDIGENLRFTTGLGYCRDQKTMSAGFGFGF
jgi:hypothetical protein